MEILPCLITSGDIPDFSGHGVYRLVDERRTVLYVGKSQNVLKRLNTHRQSQEWWPKVAAFEWVPCSSEFEAGALERVTIAHEAPPYNTANLAPLPGRGALDPELAARLYTLAEAGQNDDLNRWMSAAHSKGWTLEEIGESVLLTRERVRQRIKGVPPCDDIDAIPPKPPRQTAYQPKVWPSLSADDVAELQELQKLATKCRGLHRPGHPYREASVALSERLAEHKARGVRYKELADAVGLTKNAVSKRLEAHGYLNSSPTSFKFGENAHPNLVKATVCKRGHELSGENVRYVNGDPSRPVCRSCDRIRTSNYYNRKKDAA